MRAGLDAVLLAAAVEVAGPARILDLGSGVGTAGLCVAARLTEARLTLIERDPDIAALAAANITDNALRDRATVVIADVTAPLGRDPATAALLGTADVVIANPPYASADAGTRSPDTRRDAAQAMPPDALDDWVRAMAALGHAHATAVMIHRADALSRVLVAFDRRFGAVTIRPIASTVGAPANRTLVTGTKGSGAPLRLLAPLIIHSADGGYRPEIEAVLRHGAALAS
jgi:tRNA1(Val) A37 N6-methylase TrmN6